MGGMSEKQGSHFYFMSLATSTHAGLGLHRHSGHLTPKRGATRLDVFNALFDTLRVQYPELADAVPISFDLQPNEL